MIDIKPFLAACGVIVATAVCASPASAQSVKVSNAWARASAPGQKTAGVYVELTSDRDTALVAAGSPLAERAELHSMTVEGGVMRMRPLARIELPAGQTVKLAPSGLHVMLIDLRRALKPGEKLPVTLSLQSAGTALTSLSIEAEVRALDGSAAHRHP